MPQAIAKTKPRITSPPKMSKATSAKSVVPEVMIVRERVSLADKFNTSTSGMTLYLRRFFTGAVKDNNRVVDRITDNGEQGRDNCEVEFDLGAAQRGRLSGLRHVQGPQRHPRRTATRTAARCRQQSQQSRPELKGSRFGSAHLILLAPRFPRMGT